jgi:deoxycytidylate deaminase
MCKSYEDTELVIGLVAPVGVDLDSVIELLRKILIKFNYDVSVIGLSQIIQEEGLFDITIDTSTRFKRINTLMTAGNEFRRKAKNNGILSMYAIKKILEKRQEDAPLKKTIHIIKSLKNPEEVLVFRRVYSNGFFLLGISSSIPSRLDHLIKSQHMSSNEANSLIKRDESEDVKYGQRVRDVYHQSDAFMYLDQNPKDYEDSANRIIELIFGNPFHTPTNDEYGIFLACASALRSGDLSRQVGAIIISENGEVVSAGSNDVPKYGGGLYWPEDKKVCRDIEKGFDSNEIERSKIICNIMYKIHEKYKIPKNLYFCSPKTVTQLGKSLLTDTGVLDITEYGRAVHAEMEAILSCTRMGISTRGATLYCTTFPCHNCAKHLVACGIAKVVYIEPYPKSRALQLHSDSICISTQSDPIPKDKVVFQPFVGIAQRKYIDLFSIKKSTVKIERESDGTKLDWRPGDANIPLPLSLLPSDYIE